MATGAFEDPTMLKMLVPNMSGEFDTEPLQLNNVQMLISGDVLAWGIMTEVLTYSLGAWSLWSPVRRHERKPGMASLVVSICDSLGTFDLTLAWLLFDLCKAPLAALASVEDLQPGAKNNDFSHEHSIPDLKPKATMELFAEKHIFVEKKIEFLKQFSALSNKLDESFHEVIQGCIVKLQANHSTMTLVVDALAMMLSVSSVAGSLDNDLLMAEWKTLGEQSSFRKLLDLVHLAGELQDKKAFDLLGDVDVADDLAMLPTSGWQVLSS